jgi:hypothetical protein
VDTVNLEEVELEISEVGQVVAHLRVSLI